MPEVKKDIPTLLKPYTFFGVDLEYQEGKDQCTATCPLCSRENKFYVSSQTGQFHCKTCSEQGNVYTFLKLIWSEGTDASDEFIGEVATDRRLSPNTVRRWEVLKHEVSGDWCVAGYNAEGKISNLYRRLWNPGEKRFYFNGPKGLSHGLFGLPLFEADKDDVFICEGVWDAMALWEMLTTTKYNASPKSESDPKYLATNNVSQSLYSNANVIAVPTATVFSEYWTPLFAGKRVYLCYDNDLPNKKSGTCAALEGMRHAANILMRSSDLPKEIHYIKWGEGKSSSGIVGYDPTLKHGYDLRDLLLSPEKPNERREALSRLFSLFDPVPPSWIEGAKGSKGKPVIPTIETNLYAEVVEACRKALIFTEGMDKGLSVMLAVSACVEIGGDQLWCKFIGPPSSGKTTLADGLVMAKKYAVMKSITTGLHSGYRDKESEGGKDDDFSMMNLIKNKAVIIKDGDTLVQAENLPRILSELRDAYDRKSSTHYRNRVIRDYEDHSFALLLFGTPNSMRKLDQSELGQRFIDCVVMEGIDTQVEREINTHTINGFEQLMASQAILNGDRTEGTNKQRAKQLIGGYLEYLRKNIVQLISEVRISESYKTYLSNLATFVAIFRARPSTMHVTDEDHVREMSPRLVQQFGKLAWGLTVVLNKKTVDEEVMRRVMLCAIDTARGKTLRIASSLITGGSYTNINRLRMRHAKTTKAKDVETFGMDSTSLSQRTNIVSRELGKLIIFLKGINVIESAVPNEKRGFGSKVNRWRLTEDVKKLYKDVMRFETTTSKE